MMNEYAHEVIGVIPPTCFVCNKGSEPIPVNKVDFQLWRSGTLIQIAFPEMPKETRELLISGVHPECWETLWSDEGDGANE